MRKTSFIYAGEPAEFEIKPEGGVDHLIAPRRTVLDRVLVDAARTSGAEIRHGVSLQELVIGCDGKVTGCTIQAEDGSTEAIRADLVIGADGRQSSVARLVGAEFTQQGRASMGVVYGYFEGLPDRGFEWYFADGVAGGVIPTNHGQHCVFMGVTSKRFAEVFRADMEAGFMQVATANAPELADRLSRARRADRFRAFGGVPGYFRHSAGAGWALVGDAGYFKDPLTAHGITDALRDAHLLARSIVQDGLHDLSRYQEERDALSADLFAVTEQIASFAWDMEGIGQLHRRLSRTMKAECAWLADDLGPKAIAA